MSFLWYSSALQTTHASVTKVLEEGIAYSVPKNCERLNFAVALQREALKQALINSLVVRARAHHVGLYKSEIKAPNYHWSARILCYHALDPPLEE